MNKHMRKNGITAHKFMVEVHMTKVELKLAQQCRISVIFKRGEHRIETVNAPVLDKGIAIFDEKLSVPSIFYYDEAKNAFVSKEATLALNMISSKAHRLIGVTKFDLATYLNNNMKETNVDLKMEKCFDKNARFHFKLKMAQLSELDPCTSFKEDDESLSNILNEDVKQTTSKVYFAEKHPDLSELILADNSDIGDGRSPSPQAVSIDSLNGKNGPASHRNKSPRVELDTSIDEKISQKKVTQKAPLSSRDRDKKSPRQDVRELPIQKSKTMSSKEKEPQRLNHKEETPRWANTLRRPESPFDQSKDGSKPASSHFDDANRKQKVSPRARNGNNKETGTKKEDMNKSQNTVSSFDDISHNDLDKELNKYNEEVDKQKQKITELENKLNESEKIIKDLKDQLEYSNGEFFALTKSHDELQQQYNNLQVEYQNLHNETSDGRKSEKRIDFELGIYKEKVTSLQNDLEIIKIERDDALKKLEEQKVQQFRSIEAIEETQKIPKADRSEAAKIEEYNDTIAKLRNELAEFKKKFNENQSLPNKEGEKDKSPKAGAVIEIFKLQKEAELKDKKIAALESRIQDLEDEVNLMKLQEARNKLHSIDLISQSMEKVEATDANESPENLQKKNKDLTMQNLTLRKELEQVKKILSLNQIDNEDRRGSSSHDSLIFSRNECEEDMEKRINKLELENARITSELKKAKMGWAAADIEKYTLMNTVKDNQDKSKVKDERIDFLEIELFRLKNKMAELVNTVMEFGGVEMLDKIEEIVSIDKSAKMSFQEDRKRSVLS